MRLTPWILAVVAAGISLPAHAALTIKAAATTNVSCIAQTCTATAADAVLNIKTLKTMLRRGDATVVSGSLASDITVGTALPWTSTGTLTLDSYRSILIERPVSVQGTGGLTLTTNDGGTGGALTFPQWGRVTFLDLSSHLTIDGHAYTLIGDIATLAADSGPTSGNGYYALAADYNAGPDGTYNAPPVYSIKDVFEGLGNSISNLTMYNSTTGTWTGLVRYVSGTVRNLALLNVAITGYANGGALAYENDGMISRVYSTGSIHVGNGGGLMYYNKGTIIFSHSDASVSGAGFVGGLVSNNTGISPAIIQSFATGTVFTGGTAGGLVSTNSGTITACYSRGDVSGGTAYSGGFVGQAYDASIAQAYETGAVTGGGAHGGGVGGFAGQNDSTISSAYWDQTTTGMKGKPHGTGDGKRTTGITPTTSAKLKTALPDGFDPALWGLDHMINSGFPYLLNNPG